MLFCLLELRRGLAGGDQFARLEMPVARLGQRHIGIGSDGKFFNAAEQAIAIEPRLLPSGTYFEHESAAVRDLICCRARFEVSDCCVGQCAHASLRVYMLLRKNINCAMDAAMDTRSIGCCRQKINPAGTNLEKFFAARRSF